jgi:hypothetical protein
MISFKGTHFPKDVILYAVFFAGSRYFCESLFWASQPKQAAKT